MIQLIQININPCRCNPELIINQRVEIHNANTNLHTVCIFVAEYRLSFIYSKLTEGKQ